MSKERGAPVGKFGEKLQRERELRGITLEEIAGATKIGTRSLRALEQEQFEKLPGGIFNKGFVRAYARYLGIDEEQAVADYMAACGDPDAEPVLPALEAARRAQAARTDNERLPSNDDESSFARPLITSIVLLVVVVALGVGAWRFYPRVKDRLAQRRATSTAPAPPTGIAPATLVPQAVPAPQTTTAAAAPPVPVTAPPAPIPSASPVVDKPASVAAQAPAPQTPLAPEFTVLIRAREESWVSIKADGKLVVKDTLAAGKETSIKAKEVVVLTAGNAGGVEVSIDGKPQPSFGDNNQVRTVVVTSAGFKAAARP